MKKLILLLCMTAMLTACGQTGADEDGRSERDHGKGSEMSEPDDASENDTKAENNIDPTTDITTETSNSGYNNDTAAESAMTYRQILETLYYSNSLPDGTPLDYQTNISDNTFAVHDIDGDGRDELIIMYTATYTAGMFVRIYDLDSVGNVVTELWAFPSLRFYDSGVIEVDISHNQGYSGEFWPYTLYQYDAGADEYTSIAFVEAMDKNLVDSINEYAAEAGAGSENLLVYPQEADTSGSGFVYYIRPAIDAGDVSPVDVTEYEAWHDQYVGGAHEIKPEFLNITEENIRNVEQ